MELRAPFLRPVSISISPSRNITFYVASVQGLFKDLPYRILGEIQKTVSVAGAVAETPSINLPNKSLACYCWTIPFGY